MLIKRGTDFTWTISDFTILYLKMGPVWKYLLRLSHLSHCRQHLQYFPRTFAAPLQFLLQSLNCIGWNWKKFGFNIAHCFYCQISKVQDFYEALKATKILSYVTFHSGPAERQLEFGGASVDTKIEAIDPLIRYK